MAVTLAQAFWSLHISLCVVVGFFSSETYHLSTLCKDSLNQPPFTCHSALWDSSSESSFCQLFVGQHFSELIADNTPGKATKQLLLILWGVMIMLITKSLWCATVGLAEPWGTFPAWLLNLAVLHLAPGKGCSARTLGARLRFLLNQVWCYCLPGVFAEYSETEMPSSPFPFQRVFLWILVPCAGLPILYQSSSAPWMTVLLDIGMLSEATLSWCELIINTCCIPQIPLGTDANFWECTVILSI